MHRQQHRHRTDNTDKLCKNNSYALVWCMKSAVQSITPYL